MDRQILLFGTDVSCRDFLAKFFPTVSGKYFKILRKASDGEGWCSPTLCIQFKDAETLVEFEDIKNGLNRSNITYAHI